VIDRTLSIGNDATRFALRATRDQDGRVSLVMFGNRPNDLPIARAHVILSDDERHALINYLTGESP
jgi:hypothetical protein